MLGCVSSYIFWVVSSPSLEEALWWKTTWITFLPFFGCL